ncbi:unnamed protein product [Leptosia nina]|uniref:Disks large-associated protein 5 n=1 Tax=Leptosia nina TaxID=320188 RepID=A0AAV1J635_9NEOP
MEKDFNFIALLNNHDKQHKSKPDQFTSVAKGVKKRLELTNKRRRSSRLTIFDRIRNLPQNSPVRKPTKEEVLKQKAEHRKMQLEKWKEEKEKKKKEAASQKKKPFIVGVARPPPKLKDLPKVLPSSSGRVTRSQTAKCKEPTTRCTSQIRNTKSFAPEHALFCPPAIKGMKELPLLQPPTKKKDRTAMVQFKPIVPETQPHLKLKTSKTVSRTRTNDRSACSQLNPKAVKNTEEGLPKSKAKVTKKGKEEQKTTKEVFNSDHSNKSSNQINEKDSKTKQRKEKPTHFVKNTESAEGGSYSSEDHNISASVTQVYKTKGKKYILGSYQEKSSISDDNNHEKPEILGKNLNNKLGNKKLLNSTPISINSSSEDSTSSPAVMKTRKSSNFAKRSGLKEVISVITPEKPKGSRKSLKSSSNRHPSLSVSGHSIPCISLDSTKSESSIGSPVIKRPTRKSHPLNKCTPVKQNKEKTYKTPVKPIPNCESSSEERLKSPKDAPMTPEQITDLAKRISPCITMSRGKDNARREMQKKLKDGLLEEHLDTLDSVDHFNQQLNSETARLTEMANHWEKILEHNTLPDIVQEAILAAVGQARLLMSQKFQQFAGLVERCEAPDPDQPLVTPTDLQGFWDMVYMQVENLNARFKNLEEMQSRGWVVETKASPQQKKRKVPAKSRTKPAATSRLKAMIAAARKAATAQDAPAPEVEGSKTFEAGFFCVTSPVRSPAPATPNKLSTPNKPSTLLKAVLSSEAKKSASKSAASFAMLRASMIGKNVDPDSEIPADLIQFTPVNLKATPGRSILKSSAKKSNGKSIKMVLFDSSDANILDSSIDNDISGVRKLDTLDSENDSPIEKSPTLDEKHSDDNTSPSTEEEAPPFSMYINQNTEKEKCQANENENPMMTRKLVRQDAICSPVRTCSRNKTETPRTMEKKVLQETNVNTPRRSLRRRTTVSDA